MNFSQINIRDPFILPDNGKYYLYGTRGYCAWGNCTGLDVYTSDDLENWSESHEAFTKPEGFWSDLNYWAPEVHKYKGKYYMFVSFKSEERRRGTQILVADSPMGPFRVHSDGPVTPVEWECLDGTFYVDENSVPYMVFCHEWVQVQDGEICVIRLSDDLKEPVGEPQLLFRASEPFWARKDAPTYVTDGPFIYKTSEGKLLMLWSSFTDSGYLEAIAFSENGKIDGKWQHSDRMLFSDDGGHGMVFKTFDGRLMFIMHAPNQHLLERPRMFEIFEENGTLIAK